MRRPYIRRNRAAANWISSELRATDFLAAGDPVKQHSCQLAPSSAASSCLPGDALPLRRGTPPQIVNYRT